MPEDPGRVHDQRVRSTVVTVMAEHGVDDPVWDRPYGTGYPLDLADLGVSPHLVGRLRTWKTQYEALGLTDFAWPHEGDEQRWADAGLDLALALQDELWDVEVRYFHGDPADRDLPVRERRHRRPGRGR